MKAFDLVVIGTGSGLDVAVEAAENGLSVAIVEEGPFGGTCHNRGCIPSKMLIHVADVMETIMKAGQFGIKASVESVDWLFIVKRTFENIDEEARQIEEANRSQPNTTVYKGAGRFVGHKTLEVNGERIRGETVLISAGTRPLVPNISGLESVPYYTSDDVMRLPVQPRRMVIVGGGYIAAEMGHFFGSLGTEVTFLVRSGAMVREEDAEISRRFTEIYKDRFNVLLNTRIAGVSKSGEAIRIETDKGEEVECDVLLLAAGRVPNSDVLEVARTGVEFDERGYVRTDEYMETNVPGIWALGDIVGRYLLKHSANLESAYAANNMFNPDNKVPVDYYGMPHAIFASPQVAGVGLTEQAAREDSLPHVAVSYRYYDTAYGASIEDKDGLVKVIADPETSQILGCHIMGTDASALIQEVANAMRLRLTTDAITQSIYVHPALPEVVQRAFNSI